MRKLRTKRGGFTLIEVLVVLLVASIVFAVLASVLGSSFEVLRTGETRAKLNATLRSALDYVCNDIASASNIPLSTDRDLNGYPDDNFDPTLGYDEDAVWLVAHRDSQGNPVVASSYFISEAWGDRLMLSHKSEASGFSGDMAFGANDPDRIVRNSQPEADEWTSFFRLAIPASADMPYYLASEADIDRDGVLDPGELYNTGAAAGTIVGYPEQVLIGLHKETAVLIQDKFMWPADGSGVLRRERQIPIGSGITGVKFEYLHEVPVYMSRLNANRIQVAYQNSETGEVEWFDTSSTRDTSMEGFIPILSHWEMRVVDVAYDVASSDGLYHDSLTEAVYAPSVWQLRDQYPEGCDAGKEDGTHVAGQSSIGLGTADATGGTGWNCSVFYNIDCPGGYPADDNGPLDRLAFVTTGLDGSSNPIEGGIAMIRPDSEVTLGAQYYTMTTNPTGLGDLGDADGIPDGDGVPDDPVPGWWLPYVKAVRVTIIASPKQVIDDRRTRSGQTAKGGNPLDPSGQNRVWYRLDSPVPYADPNRIRPLYNQKVDYIGAGRDVVMTRTVPVDFDYSAGLELAYDPADARLAEANLRRVDLNYFQGAGRIYPDPVGPYEPISARTPTEKLIQKEYVP